jgi:hypothetical protein
MSTRAERFRSTTARQGASSKQGGKPPPAPVEKTTAGTRRSAGPRNLPLGKKAVYALEDAPADQRPSRKSSRGGTNRVKAATALTDRQKLRVSSPTSRHDRG